MTLDDLDAVESMEDASFPNPWNRKSLEDELRHEHALCKVAEVEQEIAGYLCTRVFLGEAHVMKIAVRPNLRRRRIASALVRGLMGLLRDGRVERIFLEVRASNAAAVRFYEGFGFKVISRRRRYYSHPDEDAIVMTCG
jgi:ribosomal-protein-alanine N-acetyltransferase